MPSLRADLAPLTAALVGLVFGLDLLWNVTGVSSGSPAYGLVAAPVHLATCVIALRAVAEVRGARLQARFVTAALVASVAIDLDHIPSYLGSHFLAGALPRPYPHSLLLVAALATLGWASRRGAREVWFGIAFGVSVHLFRDLVTGPGVPLAWPISSGVLALPYAVFAGVLAMAALAVALAERSVRATVGSAGPLWPPPRRGRHGGGGA